jgi:2-dehydro-3-deoxy-L-rhamnonate dehydrogenase (NAD+)
MINGRFSEQAGIITGGAAGVGLATARRIVAEGGRVAIWDANDGALAMLDAEPGIALALKVDVADADAVEEAAAKSAQALGRIDMLMCSAGITGPTAPVEQYPRDGWRKVIDINLTGVFYSCQTVIPYMRANGYGRIVNMSSVGGKEGNPNAAAYAASKSGLLGFTKALGKELATSGIVANSVTPAVFRTALLEQMPQSQVDYMVSKIPMGRIGEQDEVAAMVCWLLSRECSFSTGATFDISGGRATY